MDQPHDTDRNAYRPLSGVSGTGFDGIPSHHPPRDSEQEQARLEGIRLAAREMAHLLNNDLTPAIGILAMLQRHPAVPPELRELVDNGLASLHTVSEHIRRFQQIRRVETKMTSTGPTLDLDRSTQPWPR